MTAVGGEPEVVGRGGEDAAESLLGEREEGRICWPIGAQGVLGADGSSQHRRHVDHPAVGGDGGTVGAG